MNLLLTRPSPDDRSALAELRRAASNTIRAIADQRTTAGELREANGRLSAALDAYDHPGASPSEAQRDARALLMIATYVALYRDSTA